jgi:hypothetical protein
VSIKHAQADGTPRYKTWFMSFENPLKRCQFEEHILKLLLKGFTIINCGKIMDFHRR